MTSHHYILLYAILFTRDDKPPLYPNLRAMTSRPPHTITRTNESTTLSQHTHTRTPHAYCTNKNGTLPRKSCVGESTNTYITLELFAYKNDVVAASKCHAVR